MNRIASVIASSFLGAGICFFVGASAVQATSLNYVNNDTRSQGAFAPVAFSNDGDGSLKMQTFDGTSNGKVSVVFGTGGVLGTLGSINALSADFYKASSPATGVANQFAYRLWTNPTGTQALVWENNYNGSGTVPVDQWNTVNLLGGNFWQRANGQNFDTVGNWTTLSTFASGFTPPGGATLSSSTPIYGVEVSFGSGISAFTGYVDHIRIAFAGGGDYSANISAVPLPAAAWAGMSLLGSIAGFGGLKRLRMQRAV